MSNYGRYRSYGNMVYYRCIFHMHNGYYTRKLGIMKFGPIRDPLSSMPIGSEITTRIADKDEWLFRAYHDGTAMYRRNALSYKLNRRTTFYPIDTAITDHYYTVRRIAETNVNLNYGDIHIMRRKPVSGESVQDVSTDNLGDYLISKYNVGV